MTTQDRAFYLTSENPFIMNNLVKKNIFNPNNQQKILCNNVLFKNNIFLLLFLVSACYSFYLWWNCNEKYNYDMNFKILYSVFAFLSGPLYIIWYYAIKQTVCEKIKNN